MRTRRKEGVAGWLEWAGRGTNEGRSKAEEDAKRRTRRQGREEKENEWRRKNAFAQQRSGEI